jgi:hypothetical protein
MPITFLDWRRSHHQAIGPIRDRVIPTVVGAIRQAKGTLCAGQRLTAGSGHIGNIFSCSRIALGIRRDSRRSQLTGSGHVGRRLRAIVCGP